MKKNIEGIKRVYETTSEEILIYIEQIPEVDVFLTRIGLGEIVTYCIFFIEKHLNYIEL